MNQQMGRGAAYGQSGWGRGIACSGRGRAPAGPRAFKSKISEVENETFNVGSTKFVAQFQKSKESIAYYIQRTIRGEEGFYAAKETRTGEIATVPLPTTLANDATDDDRTIRTIEVQAVGKLGKS